MKKLIIELQSLYNMGVSQKDVIDQIKEEIFNFYEERELEKVEENRKRMEELEKIKRKQANIAAAKKRVQDGDYSLLDLEFLGSLIIPEDRSIAIVLKEASPEKKQSNIKQETIKPQPQAKDTFWKKTPELPKKNPFTANTAVKINPFEIAPEELEEILKSLANEVQNFIK